MYPIKPPITGSNNNAIETISGENQRKTAFIPVCPSNPGPSDKQPTHNIQLISNQPNKEVSGTTWDIVVPSRIIDVGVSQTADRKVTGNA